MARSRDPDAARRAPGYDVRLAERVLCGCENADEAAMAFLERWQPETLRDAIGLLADHGRLTVEGFDRLADAWTTFRHLMHLGWD